MIIDRYRHIAEIGEIWTKNIKNNSSLSVFQTYEWNRGLEDKFYSIPERIKNAFRDRWKLWYYVYRFSDHIIVAPIIISRKHKCIAIFGQQDMSDYLSFIFCDSIPAASIVAVINHLKEQFQGYELILDRINESNDTMRAAIDSITTTLSPVKKNCVKIPIIENLIETIKSDARRYVKQGYNRLREDNLFHEAIISKRRVESREGQLLHAFFKTRYYNKFKYNVVKKVFSLAEDKLYRILGTDNTIYYYLKYIPDLYVFEYYINSNQAAYMVGVEHNNEMSILRISIDDNLFNYRPEIILILKSIEYINNTHKNINYIDFSRGDESYKLNYGGIIHTNYCYSIK